MKLGYRIGYSLFKFFGKTLFDYEVVNRERLIEDRPALIAANHASFIDPPMVGIAFRGAIYYLARKTLFRGVIGAIYRKWNAIPVDQERADFSSLKTIIRLLRKGERVLIFPEGARTWDGELQPGEPGVGLVVAKAQAPVVPVRLFGTYEALPRGASWPSCVRVTLVVGEPIDFSKQESTVTGKERYREISEQIMEAIAALELPSGREPIAGADSSRG